MNTSQLRLSCYSNKKLNPESHWDFTSTRPPDESKNDTGHMHELKQYTSFPERCLPIASCKVNKIQLILNDTIKSLDKQ